MSYIILGGRLCDFVLNVHAPVDSYEELECVFHHCPKYNLKILLGNFIALVSREDIFKPTAGNESLHKISNGSGVKVLNFATSKNPIVKGAMFPHHNIHKFTWTSTNGKTYS
jgi:hypothetical protein